jgi:hypothetical protein
MDRDDDDQLLVKIRDGDREGLAKAFDTADPAAKGGLTITGDMVGTMRYMAPERFRGWSDPRRTSMG